LKIFVVFSLIFCCFLWFLGFVFGFLAKFKPKSPKARQFRVYPLQR
jgi:hypothetical protein